MQTKGSREPAEEQGQRDLRQTAAGAWSLRPVSDQPCAALPALWQSAFPGEARTRVWPAELAPHRGPRTHEACGLGSRVSGPAHLLTGAILCWAQ